jgi:uncharacterized membrane protein YcaP (DUF421 family)
MVIYACVSLFISFITTKSIILRRFLVGKPFTLLKHGQIYEDNFRKTKLDINEFLSSMRNEGYFDISKIELAVLESNGKISFMPKAEYRPLTPNDKKIKPDPEGMVLNLIVDGNIIYKNLDYSGRDMTWLNKELKKPASIPLRIFFWRPATSTAHYASMRRIKNPQPIDVWI